MFPYAIKAINELRPHAFVFENVKGLLRSSFAEYFEYIILRLKYPDCTDLGYSDWNEHLVKLCNLENCLQTPPEYNVEYQLINAADYGIPQTRERVIIVGIRANVGSSFEFPKPEHSLERLLWDQYVSGEYWKNMASRPL